jgi:cellobiose-specific phosphotransferase system component IIC
LNHRELAEFFNSSSTPTVTPEDTNKFLWIGGIGLVFSLLFCLLVLSRRNWKKR